MAIGEKSLKFLNRVFHPADAEHDDAVRTFEALKQSVAARTAATQAALAKAQAAYDLWQKPARDLEAARVAHASISWQLHTEHGAAERAVKGTPTQALREFADEVETLSLRLRATKPPAPEAVTNVLTDRTTIKNADAIAKTIDAIHGPVGANGRREKSVLLRATESLYHELPWLDSTRQRARIAELRAEIEATFADVDVPSAKDARERVL
jgi:hypothetical protein